VRIGRSARGLLGRRRARRERGRHARRAPVRQRHGKRLARRGRRVHSIDRDLPEAQRVIPHYGGPQRVAGRGIGHAEVEWGRLALNPPAREQVAQQGVLHRVVGRFRAHALRPVRDLSLQRGKQDRAAVTLVHEVIVPEARSFLKAAQRGLVAGGAVEAELKKIAVRLHPPRRRLGVLRRVARFQAVQPRARFFAKGVLGELPA
jgi:hypothetical protein